MAEVETPRHTNRLIGESSPYLRQHAHNPVDWYPWGEEALARSRAENKPMLLSIGYAACHWCHVMEHESFEDEATAREMNENFVCIKVDREERPDLDTIYMQATQLMSGSGGWPMTVFLTPDALPFFAGTYFPPESRYGMPSFRQLLASMKDAWTKRNGDVQENARKMHAALQKMASTLPNGEAPAGGELTLDLIDRAVKKIGQRYDERNGGFGGAPKFPQSMSLSLLLRHYHRTRDPRSRQMVENTLKKMARGGMYDQLGGGFHRYSVDEYWLVPHFEKMLYDNALLASVYLETHLCTKDEFYRNICTDTITYVLRDMTGPLGGFYATEDADSEGEEGRFYVWTPDQIRTVLGDEDQARAVCEYWDVGPHGNFEHGNSILNVSKDADVAAARVGLTTQQVLAAVTAARTKLFAARQRRVRPMRDEKIIACWNGLMLDTLARAAAALDRLDWRAAAKKNADFIMAHLWDGGHLMRIHDGNRAKLNGYLEDYAAVANGMLSVYEDTGDLVYFEHAKLLVDRMIALFEDTAEGGFFFTSNDHEALITRFKDPYDNATPSGTSLAVTALLRLGALTGDIGYTGRAERILKQMRDACLTAPTGFGYLLCAADFFLRTPFEIAVVTVSTTDGDGLKRQIFSEFIPNKVVAFASMEDTRSAHAIPLLAGKTAINREPTAYVCKNFTCQEPVTGVASLRKALGID